MGTANRETHYIYGKMSPIASNADSHSGKIFFEVKNPGRAGCDLLLTDSERPC